MLGKLKAWSCIRAGRKRQFVTVSIKFSFLKGLLKMQHLKKPWKQVPYLREDMLRLSMSQHEQSTDALHATFLMVKKCYNSNHYCLTQQNIISLPHGISIQTRVLSTNSHSALIQVQLAKSSWLSWHSVYRETQCKKLSLTASKWCREQTVNRWGQNLLGNAFIQWGMLELCKVTRWHFKVLKSTSCLWSYLTVTLSPRLLTPPALGSIAKVCSHP